MKIPGRTRDDYFRRQRLSRRRTSVSCRRFCSSYIDGGAYAEHTLRRNVEDLSDVALRQRILRNMSGPESGKRRYSTRSWRCRRRWRRSGCAGCTPAAAKCRPPPRGGRQRHSVHLSTVSVCPIEEVAPTIKRPMWFQLYVLRDRGFMRNALERAKAAGCLDAGLYRRYADSRRPLPRRPFRHERPERRPAPLLAGRHPSAVGVGRRRPNGRPHDLGNISAYLGKPTGLEDYIGWLANNFDPSISPERPGVDPRFLGRSDGDQRDPRSGGRPRRGALRR